MRWNKRNMQDAIANAECVVLPSYFRACIPLNLLEAAGCGRPAIATDRIGRRKEVVDEETGFLCSAGDVGSLVVAMQKMLSSSHAERE